MSKHICFGMVFVMLPGLALADWRDHKEYPQWCQRGIVRWGHGPGPMDTAAVDVMRYCGINLKQAGRFTNNAADYARQRGLMFMPYICSKTILWPYLFPRFPQLKRCTCVGPEGRRRIMHGNPSRYAGCYNNPTWLDYIKMRVKEAIEKSHPVGIFFDNVSHYDCYCKLCRAKFAKYTARKFGVAMDLANPKAYPNFSYAKTFFQADSTYEFFQKLRAYIRSLDPEVLIVPNFHVGVGNGWTVYLTMRGMNDLVFYESGYNFPPFTRQVIGYKVGLAASHGKVVGRLLGLPPTVANDRVLRWIGRWGGPREVFAYPEEFRLAMAEAAACDGTFIPSFWRRNHGIYPSDDPHQRSAQDALRGYNTFLESNEKLYRLAQPAANIAVFHSVYSRMADRPNYWPNFTRICRALMNAGIAYELIVEDDLRPGCLEPYDALILPPAPILSKDNAHAILDYAERGKGIVVLGELARMDRLSRPYTDRSLPSLARLPVREHQLVGNGRVWMPHRAFDRLSVKELVRGLESVSRGIAYRISPPNAKLFVNALKSNDGRFVSVHLVNYDFEYRRRLVGEVADDDGFTEAKAWFYSTKCRAKKILMIENPASFKKPFIRFFGVASGTGFELVVSFNGRLIKSFPAKALRAAIWHEVAVPKDLLKKRNEVVLRVTGRPGYPNLFTLMVDTSARTRRSAWSGDDGKTFTTRDISPARGIQQGEYAIRLADGSRRGATVKASDLEGLLRVNDAGPVELIVRHTGRKPSTATLLSPDYGPSQIEPQIKDGRAIYVVPKVHIYSVLVITVKQQG